MKKKDITESLEQEGFLLASESCSIQEIDAMHNDYSHLISLINSHLIMGESQVIIDIEKLNPLDRSYSCTFYLQKGK